MKNRTWPRHTAPIVPACLVGMGSAVNPGYGEESAAFSVGKYRETYEMAGASQWISTR